MKEERRRGLEREVAEKSGCSQVLARVTTYKASQLLRLSLIFPSVNKQQYISTHIGRVTTHRKRPHEWYKIIYGGSTARFLFGYLFAACAPSATVTSYVSNPETTSHKCLYASDRSSKDQSW